MGQEIVETSGTTTTTTKPQPIWHNIIAGGVAGAGSRIATAPLDLIRIRRQLQGAVYPSESLLASWSRIVKDEGGVTALFRGNVAAVYLWIGYTAVQFTLYNQVKEQLEVLFDDPQRRHPAMVAFGAGATAGLCATLLTYPFDVCRTAFAARGIQGAAPVQSPLRVKNNHKKAQVPFSSLVEPDYHHRPPPPPPVPPQPRVHLPFSSLVEPEPTRRLPISFSPPTAVTSISTSKTMMPSSSSSTNISPPKHLTDFARHVYRTQGLVGFYAGAGPAVLQIIPYMGLNFAIYDALTQGDRRVYLSAYAGSLSGAMSKLLIYPIDTIKRRLQAQAFYQSNNTSYKNMWDCVSRIVREEGVSSLYRGVVPSVLKTTISTSLSFALFRLTKNGLEHFMDDGRVVT